MLPILRNVSRLRPRVAAYALLVRAALSGRFQADVASLYQAKLEERAQQLGLKNADELKAHLKDDIARVKKELNAVDPLRELEEYERQQAENNAGNANNATKIRDPVSKKTPQAPYKTMESYVDVGKFVDLPLDHVEFLWRARFALDPRNLHAVLTSTQFASIYANAFRHPSFVLPLPKGDGYEMHFVQWQFVGPQTTHCMITTVAEYKLHHEYAKPHTSIAFHQELSHDKNVVLMNGYCETESSLSMDEAQLLVLNVQRFYGGVGDAEGVQRRQRLLEAFTKGTAEFSMDQLVKEATSFE